MTRQNMLETWQTFRVAVGEAAKQPLLKGKPFMACNDVIARVDAATALFKEEKTLLEVVPGGRAVIVFGDTHGQLHDVLNALETISFVPEERTLLFNGDIVDRGSWGLELLLLIATLKVAFPTSVFMTRGNHESAYCTRFFGFREEVRWKYSGLSKVLRNGRHTLQSTAIMKACLEMFENLPLAALVGTTLICHGGLWRAPSVKKKRKRKHGRHGPNWARHAALNPPESLQCPCGDGRTVPGGQDSQIDSQQTSSPTKLSARGPSGNQHPYPELTDLQPGQSLQPTVASLEGVPATGGTGLDGLPDPSAKPLGTLAHLRASCKGQQDPDPRKQAHQIACDVMWSDPMPEAGFAVNEARGVGLVFGPDQTEAFMRREGVRLIVRSHEGPDARRNRDDMQSLQSGFCVDHRTPAGDLVTIFSAPDYPQHDPDGDNDGAVLELHGPEYTTYAVRGCLCVLVLPVSLAKPQAAEFDTPLHSPIGRHPPAEYICPSV